MTGRLNKDFFDVFWKIGLVNVVLAWGIVFLETQNKTSDVFSYNEVQPDSQISRIPLIFKLALVGGGLALVFSLGAFGLGSPIIDLPQPFNPASLALVGDVEKVFFNSIVPGFFEEAAMFTVSFSLFYITKALKIGFMFGRILSAIGSGIILTVAHAKVYGSDQAAYLGIFVFETTVQFFNLLSGGFFSFIPHVVHNAAVTLLFFVSFSIGGTALMLIPLWRKKDGRLRC